MPPVFQSPYNHQLLQSQDFRVGQGKETCIGLIQENSMENSVQDLSTLYTTSS